MFILRRGGTNEFLSMIDPDAANCFPPGDVEYVAGWDNPEMLKFSDVTEAQIQAKLAEEIDGVTISIEEID